MKSKFHLHFIKGMNVLQLLGGMLRVLDLDEHRDQETESATLTSYKFQDIESS